MKNELAAMLFYFTRKRNWGFTISKLNERMREYAWPANSRPPCFTEGSALEEGTKGGYCKLGCHVHMTSGDVMVFVRHSIDLMLPLIGDVEDSLWRCWVSHVKYVRRRRCREKEGERQRKREKTEKKREREPERGRERERGARERENEKEREREREKK